MGPSKESLSVLYKSFLRSLLTYASPGWFPFLALPILPNWNAFTERLVAPSPAASRPPLSLYYSPRLLYLPYESLWLTSLFHLMSGLFVSQPPFLFQDWPDLEWNQDFADRPGELLRPLTRSCFLLPLLGRLFLLALFFLLEICPRSPWSSLFPLYALALIPLTLAKVRLSPTLTLSSLMIWYSGQTVLFLFRLVRAARASLPTALSMALRSLLPFRQAQYAKVFPLKPAPFCTLFAGLGSTNKSAISLLFPYCLTLVLSSPPSFLLSQTLCQICLLFPPVLSGYNGSPDTRFSRGTTRLTSLPDGERYLRLPQSLVVSLLLSLVRTLVLSRTGGVLPLRSILTHRFPRFPLRNLCSLVMLAVSSLVFAAMDTAIL